MTSITQLTALFFGAALSISVAAEPWHCDFTKDLDSRYWTPTIVGNLNAEVTTGDFSMTLAQAAVLSLTRSATTLQFAWPSAVALRYQLQSSPNLLPGSWTNEGGPTDGTGSPLGANLLIGPEPARFFRLKID